MEGEGVTVNVSLFRLGERCATVVLEFMHRYSLRILEEILISQVSKWRRMYFGNDWGFLFVCLLAFFFFKKKRSMAFHILEFATLRLASGHLRALYVLGKFNLCCEVTG